MTCRHHAEDESCADCAEPPKTKTVPELIAEIRASYLQGVGKRRGGRHDGT